MRRNTKSNRGRKNRNLKRGGTNKKHSLKRNRKQRGGHPDDEALVDPNILAEERRVIELQTQAVRRRAARINAEAREAERRRDAEEIRQAVEVADVAAAAENAAEEANKALNIFGWTCTGKLKPKNN
jgi:hypothetical protein